MAKNYGVTTLALEEYCLLSDHHDRDHYKSFPGVKDSLLERFASSIPSEIQLNDFSRAYSRHFLGAEPIKISQDFVYGYVYRENGEKKLISVFMIEDYMHKQVVLQSRRMRVEQRRIERNLRKRMRSDSEKSD